MSIRQINVSYIQEQDRVLLRVSTAQQEELKIWLTRLLLLRFLPELDKTIANLAIQQDPRISATDDSSKKMLADFQREQKLKESNFKSQYQSEQLKPLLQGAPLLPTQISMRPLSAHSLHLSLTESLEGKTRQVELKMAEELYCGLSKLLHQVLSKSGWETLPVPQQPRVSAPPAPSKYLN